ncbi:MAG: hypothetical protein PHQ60_08805 [Sideroxydans sp.]|nr:hypothetical protein [Sideroxydans sp.]
MKSTITCIAALILLTISAQSMAGLRPGEGVERDPATGNYTAHFWEDDGEGGRITTAVLDTATRIEPTVFSTFTFFRGMNVRYAYKLSNAAKAIQPIHSIDLYGLPINARLLDSDPITASDNAVLLEFFETSMHSPSEGKWVGTGARNSESLNIGWYCRSWNDSIQNHDTSRGIQPGTSLAGFWYASPDLPGIFVAQLFGNVKYHEFDFAGEGPYYGDTEMAGIMADITAKDFVPANVAAPMIIVPNPFDPAAVLENLRAHVATWPGKQLAEAAFAAQLDLNLQAAANAYRTNQPQAAKEHIEILLDLIRRDHKDLDREDDEENEGKNAQPKTNTQRLTIDRLAARVLDFDLKYVLKRMRHDGEEKDGKKSKDKESKK